MPATLSSLHRASCAAIATAALTPFASASFVTYTSLDAWSSATSDPTTIDFSELPDYTIVSDQYAHLGVSFCPGNDVIFPDTGLFPSDGVGLIGNLGLGVGPIEIEFATPLTSIGVRFPSLVEFDLYSNGVKIGSTDWFNGFRQGGWAFAGVVSEIAFDRVVLTNQAGSTTIDTLFFGGAIPGPGGIAVLFGGALLGAAGRRRRTHARAVFALTSRPAPAASPRSRADRRH